MPRPPPAAEPPISAADYTLAQRAAAGDPAARRELVLRVLGRTRNLARYLVRDDTDAEDVAQLALIEVLRSAGGFRGEGALEKWADRITARVAFAHLARRRLARRRDVPFEEEGGAAVAAEPAAAAAPADVLLRRRLAHHLGRLNEERRTVLVLKIVGGFSLEEIAAAVDAPLNTVKDRLRVGREELRARISRDPALRELAMEIAS